MGVILTSYIHWDDPPSSSRSVATWGPQLNKTEASGKHFSEAFNGRPTAIGGGEGVLFNDLNCETTWYGHGFGSTGRWWFQRFWIFISIWGRWTHFDEHIFQMGWFNHQLVLVLLPSSQDLTIYSSKNLTKDASIPCFSRNFEFRSLPPFFILTILNGYHPRSSTASSPLVKPWWDWKAVKLQVGYIIYSDGNSTIFLCSSQSLGKSSNFSDGWVETTN